ncbi:MAG: PD-(D/E)XK nuclease family protein [Thermoanaerobaculia bacterium]
MPAASSSQVFVAPDARSAESGLLDALAAESDARPFARRLVVVPSRSLREHLLARLAARRPAWLGVEVTTLAGLARTILARAGETFVRGDSWLAVELERAAAARRPLAAAFGDFADGWAPLAAAARDLVDAGFEPEHAEALRERIDEERGALPRRTLERARELVEALAQALVALERAGLAPESTALSLAATIVGARGADAVGARVHLHGFADATGRASELLEALVRAAGATAWLVEPLPAPGAFGRRLRERLESAGGRGVEIPAASRGAAISARVAPTSELEARALAAAARAAIDRGLAPEAIAIVLRDPAAARPALWRALERAAVPFSASAGSGPLSPFAHRARGFARLLATRDEMPADAALELLGEADGSGSAHRASIRLALRALGVARLADAVALDRRAPARTADGEFLLPARSGLEDDEEGGERAPRRRLPIDALLAALDRLAALQRAAAAWPARGPWHRHAEALASVLAAAGLRGTAAGAELERAARTLAAELPPAATIESREARERLAELWRAEERVAWGGAGGGVQVLSVTEARGRTFALLLLGDLARGRFPRVVSEEPVLPDALRLRLRDLLPDLPVKREGHDEERYLFAQLLGSADEIVLSRSLHDEEGRSLPPSPLLEALARERELPVLAPPAPIAESALDRAVAAALAGRAAGLAPQLGAALAEGRRRFAPASSSDTARASEARLRILAELDTDPTSPDSWRRNLALGPYFGFLGARPAEATISASVLEAHAACGWRAFLERRLKLAPTPDPLGALPALEPAHLGLAAHATLARLFADPADAPPATVAARLDEAGRPLAWPPRSRVERVAREEAARTLADAGESNRGLERILWARMMELLDVARADDEGRAGTSILGVEVAGALALADGEGAAVTIEFRADRLEREAERVLFTDFKSGRVPDDLERKSAEKQRQALLASVASGRRLQAAIYAGSVATRAAAARYLYLGGEDHDGIARAVELGAGEETAAALAAAVATVLAARRAGLFPPRLLDPRLESEYRGCSNCPVAEACVRHDSGFRLRLERWHAREAARDGERPAREEALWRLWRLPAPAAANP